MPAFQGEGMIIPPIGPPLAWVLFWDTLAMIIVAIIHWRSWR